MQPFTFIEALEWARKQRIVLPAEYYGLLIGRARASAFSIAGISALDQIEQVKRSLEQALERGDSFGKWKKAVASGEVPLDLPAHRIETIFRTNIQGWYAAGRCRSHQANKNTRPYLMYSAINDSRTRPAHAAMDGYIATVGDPVWRTWTAPTGFNCRCTNISLTGEEAQEFGFKPFPGVSPDTGWDYSVCEDGPEEGAKRAISTRQTGCEHQQTANTSIELTLSPPWWCRHPALREMMNEYIESLGGWDDIEKLTRIAVGEAAWKRHKKASIMPSMVNNIELPLGIVIRSYTDRHLDTWPLANSFARTINHWKRPLRYSVKQIERAGLLVYLLDKALEKLPAQPGTYLRGIDIATNWPRKSSFVSAHRQEGNIIAWDGFTSVMNGMPYDYRMQFIVQVDHVFDIRDFSVSGEPELVMQRGVCMKIMNAHIKDGVYTVKMKEVDCENIRRRRRFNVSQRQ